MKGTSVIGLLDEAREIHRGGAIMAWGVAHFLHAQRLKGIPDAIRPGTTGAHDGNYVVCGMERTGTTYVTQALNLLGLKVERVHNYVIDRPDAVKVYTYRDPRDVICSYARGPLSSKKEIRNALAVTGEVPSMPTRRLAALYQLFWLKTRQLDAQLYMWDAQQGAPTLFIKYEDYFPGNEEKLVDRLFSTLPQFEPSLDVSDSNKDRILEECSMKSNKERASKLEDWEDVDDEGIHGNHISNDGLSSWKEDYDMPLAYATDHTIGNLLRMLGYEEDNNWVSEFK